MFTFAMSQAALRTNALEEQALGHAMSMIAGVPADGDLGLEGVHFEFSGWGDYYLTADGKRFAKLGQGELGRVDVHPRFSGAVIKTPVISPGIQLRNLGLTEEEVTATTAASAQTLASAGVGPRFIGVGNVGGLPVMVRERVFGRDIADLVRRRQFYAEELEMTRAMLMRMAAGGLQVVDPKPSNIMIGFVPGDEERRAWFVDGGAMLMVDPDLSPSALFDRLYQQDFLVGAWYDTLLGDITVVKPLGFFLEDGVRRSTENFPQRCLRLFGEILDSARPPPMF